MLLIDSPVMLEECCAHCTPSVEVRNVPLSPIAAIVPVSSAAIEKMLSVVSVVCCVHVAPSGEVIAKPKSPTATNSLPVQTRPSM